MSPTLAAEYAEEQGQQLEPDQQPPAYRREFCSICYTDNVSVRVDGLVYCPDCGQTSTHA
jgi:hypothetical protein